MTTEEYIEGLRTIYGDQRAAWNSYLTERGNASFQEQLNRNQSAANPSAIQQRIEEIRNTAPTDLADSDFRRIADLVIEFLPQEWQAKARDIRFVQLWTSDLNAEATRAPNGDRLVLVNRGCMVSAACASLAITEAVLHTPYTKPGTFLQKDVQLFMAALEAIGGPNISRHVDIPKVQSSILLSDPYKAGFSDMLVIAIASFILAHEFSHHVLGHQGKLVSSSFAVGGKPLEYYRFSRAQEYEADSYAWDVFSKAQHEMTQDAHIGEALSMSKFCVIAPSLFMVLVESVQTLTTGTHVTKCSEQDSHPCGFERRQALEPLALKHIDDDIINFTVAANFFLHKTLPIFSSDIPRHLTALMASPLLGYGDEYYE